MRLSRPLAGLAAAAVLATGALSGCGVADAEIRPGLAADVEGAEIGLGQVADAVADTCEVLRRSPELLQGGFTGAELRGIVVQQLVVNEVATQIAEENGLRADVLRREAEQQARISFGFTADQRDDASIPVFAASSYLSSVISEVVDPTLSEQELVEPGPAYQAFLEQWQAENDIDVNPLFDQVDFAQAATSAITSDVSTAFSEAATLRVQADELRNRAAQGDPAAQAELAALVSSLPQSQACAAEPQEAEPEQELPIPLENPGDPGQG